MYGRGTPQAFVSASEGRLRRSRPGPRKPLVVAGASAGKLACREITHTHKNTHTRTHS